MRRLTQRRPLILSLALSTTTLLACEDPTLTTGFISSRLRIETTPSPSYRSASTLTTTVNDIPSGSWAPVRVSLLNIGYSAVTVSELCLSDATGACQAYTTAPDVTFKLCGGADDSPTDCSEATLPITLGQDEAKTLTLLYSPQSNVARNDDTSLIITSDDVITRFIVNVEASSCVAAEGGGCADEGDLDADGVLDGEDNCVETPNADQLDSDGDGRGDACDEEPTTGNYILQSASISQGASSQQSQSYRVIGAVVSGAHSAQSPTYSVSGRLEL